MTSATSSGVRTNHRQEAVYLYRLNTSPEDARRLLLVYLERINELADRAEFYHLLSNSCTINIIRYANAAGRVGRLDIRHVFNGLIDSYLYGSGRVDTMLPFDELRRRSLINETAQAAGPHARLFAAHSRIPADDLSLMPAVCPCSASALMQRSLRRTPCGARRRC